MTFETETKRAALALLIALVTSTASGCASIATKGSLPTIESFETPPGSKRSITVRLYRQVDYNLGSKKEDGSVTLEKSVEFAELARSTLVESKFFSDVKVEQFSPIAIHCAGKDEEITNRILAEPLSRLKTDYFLNVVDRSGEEPDGAVVLCILSIFTVGIVPCYVPYKAHFEAILYDSKGVQIATAKSNDKIKVWTWSPLIFWPESKFLGMRKLGIDLARNAMMNLLQELFKSEKLK